MAEKPRIGNGHFFWRQSASGNRSNITVSRDEYETVAVSITVGGVGLIIQMTPDDTREMAAVLQEAADYVEQSLAVEAAGN